MTIDFSVINFHTIINSQDYIDNQRLFAKLKYIYSQSLRYGESKEFETRINLYFEYLDKYPEYEKKCDQYFKQLQQRTGYTRPMCENKNPDHDYASRMSGIFSDYVLSLFQEYYYQNNQKGQ